MDLAYSFVLKSPAAGSRTQHTSTFPCCVREQRVAAWFLILAQVLRVFVISGKLLILFVSALPHL